MMIPVSRPCVTDADVDAVADILRQGFVSGDAPSVSKCAKYLAHEVGKRVAQVKQPGG